MEGVGARLGRSSTRYGPATVFTGPVRRWKKKWVHVAPSTSNSSGAASTTTTTTSSNHSQIHALNGTTNGSTGSHLLLYKWTPITQSQNAAINGNTNTNGDRVSSKDETAAVPPDEPPRRKFKYIPIALLEEQKDGTAEDEAAEKVTGEAKAIEIDSSKDGNLDEKPDINDVPMEENQDANQVVRQDLNESTLDLSLGLNAHDSDNDPDSKSDHRDS
ncbi:uncharacterized protein LOC133788505 [Humulus lupulus]|uniref:uncharacterized protein LOC133788505 n=1 Tax=Humulus lupulus TaxID=3486 RepID=UPI002B401216|nr:uncharacterized protein LOC133788505 [Humulus lupulus]